MKYFNSYLFSETLEKMVRKRISRKPPTLSPQPMSSLFVSLNLIVNIVTKFNIYITEFIRSRNCYRTRNGHLFITKNTNAIN